MRVADGWSTHRATTPSCNGSTSCSGRPVTSRRATGSSTSAAARVRRPAPRRVAAHEGRALGVDSSAPAIERARGLADAAGLGNIAFERGDAQVHPFPGETFDLAISRFGTMFFHDAGAAFTNLARALRPAGRLVMMVWQAGARNEWDVALHQALGEGAAPIASHRRSRSRTRLGRPEILEAAGFVDIAFTDVEEPVYYGPDVAAAEAWSAASPAPASCWSGSLRTRGTGARSTAGDAVGTPARRRCLVRIAGVDRRRGTSGRWESVTLGAGQVDARRRAPTNEAKASRIFTWCDVAPDIVGRFIHCGSIVAGACFKVECHTNG